MENTMNVSGIIITGKYAAIVPALAMVGTVAIVAGVTVGTLEVSKKMISKIKRKGLKKEKA